LGATRVVLRWYARFKVVSIHITWSPCNYAIRTATGQKEAVPTVEYGMIGAVDWCLTSAKAFMVLVLVVRVLGEPTRRAADLPTGRNGAWPALHGRQRAEVNEVQVKLKRIKI